MTRAKCRPKYREPKAVQNTQLLAETVMLTMCSRSQNNVRQCGAGCRWSCAFHLDLSLAIRHHSCRTGSPAQHIQEAAEVSGSATIQGAIGIGVVARQNLVDGLQGMKCAVLAGAVGAKSRVMGRNPMRTSSEKPLKFLSDSDLINEVIGFRKSCQTGSVTRSAWQKGKQSR